MKFANILDLPDDQYLIKRMHVTNWIAIDDMDLNAEGKNTKYLTNHFVHINKKVLFESPLSLVIHFHLFITYEQAWPN